MHTLNFYPDALVDPESRESAASLEQLFDFLLAQYPPQKKHFTLKKDGSVKDKAKLLNQFGSFIINLLRVVGASKFGPASIRVPVSQKSNVFTATNPLNLTGLNRRRLSYFMDAMEHAGFITITPGKRHKYTVVAAMESFVKASTALTISPLLNAPATFTSVPCDKETISITGIVNDEYTEVMRSVYMMNWQDQHTYVDRLRPIRRIVKEDGNCFVSTWLDDTPQSGHLSLDGEPVVKINSTLFNLKSRYPDMDTSYSKRDDVNVVSRVGRYLINNNFEPLKAFRSHNFNEHSKMKYATFKQYIEIFLGSNKDAFTSTINNNFDFHDALVNANIMGIPVIAKGYDFYLPSTMKEEFIELTINNQ